MILFYCSTWGLFGHDIAWLGLGLESTDEIEPVAHFGMSTGWSNLLAHIGPHLLHTTYYIVASASWRSTGNFSQQKTNKKNYSDPLQAVHLLCTCLALIRDSYQRDSCNEYDFLCLKYVMFWLNQNYTGDADDVRFSIFSIYNNSFT